MSVSNQLTLLLLFIVLLSSVISFSLKTSTIYKLQCQITGKVYIGTTTRGIERAMKQNIYFFKAYKRGTLKTYSSMYEVVINENYNVTVLEEVHNFANDTDFLTRLKKRQKFYLEQYDEAVNKHIPLRTGKEYYVENRDHYSQYNKNYYKANEQAISQQRRKQRSPKTNCKVCNSEVKVGSLWKHNRSKRHLTALAKLNSGSESGPQYAQQLSELLNSQMLKCDLCGVECMKDALPRHMKSKRHLTALAKLNSGSESGPPYQQQLSELLNTQKVTCEVCGGDYNKGLLSVHKKTKRHMAALAKLDQSMVSSSSEPL